jgi:hypothetical protein
MNKEIIYVIENMSAPMKRELMRKVKNEKGKSEYYYQSKTLSELKKLMTNIKRNGRYLPKK